jgi:hypothetical protein
VNLVREVSNYLMELYSADKFLKLYPEAKKTIISCLEALIDFVTGPCIANQLIIGRNIRLMMFLKQLLGLV